MVWRFHVWPTCQGHGGWFKGQISTTRSRELSKGHPIASKSDLIFAVSQSRGRARAATFAALCWRALICWYAALCQIQNSCDCSGSDSRTKLQPSIVIMCIHVKWSQASLLGALFANWNNISVQTAHKKCIQIGCPEWFGHVSPCAILLGKKNAMSHFFGDKNSPITACSHYCQQLHYQRPLGFHSLSDVSGKSETSWMQFQKHVVRCFQTFECLHRFPWWGMLCTAIKFVFFCIIGNPRQ